MKIKYDFFVMGDINLDWYCPDWLPIALSEIDKNGINTYTAINERLGGSGYNFAKFAMEQGFNPLLFGCAGDDSAFTFIEKRLKQSNMDYKIILDEKLSTGKVFLGRDKKGIRFLINEALNANRQLSEFDVEQFSNLLACSKTLYISGYCLMHPEAPRTEATHKAIDIALESGKKIVFDVVPHEFYKYYAGSFWELTSKMHIIISEVATLRRYINRKDSGDWGNLDEQITDEVAMETAKRFKDEFGYQNFILRYGQSGCDCQITCSEYFGLELDDKNFEHGKLKDTRGLGDKLAIRALIEKFKLNPI